jgi:hypothetical protein
VNDEAAQTIIGLIVLVVMGVAAIMAYLCYCAILWRLGRKFQEEGFLAYCIPIYQWVLMCRCAGVSGWHTGALFVPIIGYGATVWIMGNIARRMGRSFWGFGLGAFVLVPVLILAFGSAKPIPEIEPAPFPDAPPAPLPVGRRYLLCCVQGEIAGSQIEIPAESIVIGRNPRQAQVILIHPHVSSRHARIWTETSAAGVRVWMEDLHSMNGTSFRRASDPSWSPLKGSGIALNEGDMIRVADGVAEFRVIGD